MATEKRLIDANRIVEVAERAYNAWNLANAAADGTRELNRVYKMMELCKAVRAVANDCPTVDAVEVVHGQWINWVKSGTPSYENYGTCSVCHEDAEICTEHRNYCPNCGAKMDLEV